VLRTRAREEFRAEQHLQRQGFDCFLPKIRKQVRHARKTQWKALPLFPGYIFVTAASASGRVRALTATRGVSHLVRFGEQTACLPDLLIGQLQAATGPGGEMSGASQSLAIGDTVRISGGVFDDWVGAVLDLPEPDRITLLFETAHRAIRTSLPVSSAFLVRAAAPETRGARP